MDERALAAAAARGDQAAFTRLVERYRRYLYAIAYRIVGTPEDALDVTQNVYLHLARHIGEYDGRGPLRAWLATITARQALDHRRRPGRAELPTEPQVLEGLADARHDGKGPAPWEALDREHQRRRVAAAMDRLSPQQRAIFALRFLEDLRPVEIGERLGVPAPQVRAQLARALARLRTLLAREKC